MKISAATSLNTGNPVRPAMLVAGLIASCLFYGGSASAETRSGDLSLKVVDGLISLDAQNVSLQEVLNAISLHSAMLVIPEEPLHELTAVSFEKLDLHSALKKMLRSHSYLLIQTSATHPQMPSGRLHRSTLWIYVSKSKSERNNSVESDELASLQKQLFSADTRARKIAIKKLATRSAATAVPPLAFALGDANEEVRFKAVQALAQFASADAATALATAANDELPGIRAEAAYWLGTLGGDVAIQTLQYALHDADSEVREAATSALAALSRPVVAQ